MCGICGIIQRGNQNIPTWMLRSEMTALLIDNETRGEDATGIFRAGQNPEIYKASCNARRFINTKNYWNFFNESTTFFGHTRKSTMGNPEDCNNNHPLIVGNIVAVHNGSLQSKIPPDEKGDLKGEVDSLFFPWIVNKTIQSSTSNNNIKNLKKILKNIEGSYAFCWYDLNTKDTFLCQDNILSRQIYYTIQDQYVRFSQINEKGLLEFPPHYIMKCSQNGEISWHKINVNVPQAILDFLESIPQSKWNKKNILNLLEEEYNG